MSRIRAVFPLLLLILMLACSPAFGRGWPGWNDALFPSAPSAKRFVDFDGRGFLIRGKRTYIVAGELHYSRVPRALWRDRLLRIKRAGYNTVQTYVFWNYHEAREGQYDFSGDKDLDAYLKLVHALGMYAIIRLGPYVNAEWDSGGWPIWLRFTPGVVVRDDDAPFLTALDRWLDHLMPIIRANEITRGGPIILAQLENEDSRGAGTDLPNAYFRHLRDKCVALGLDVPYFFSGVNHGDDPMGDAPWDLSARTSPWFSSEFWTGWIGVYGTSPARSRNLERATWKTIAYGGAGYAHYTIAGGTDFDYWNCNEQGVSYDFGAPIGQAGDLRDSYYFVKKAALFATSFPEILENSRNATGAYQNAATAAGVQVTARQSPQGTILFLDNPGGVPLATQIKVGSLIVPRAGPMTLAPGEIVPILENAPLTPHITLMLSAARVLGKMHQGDTTTLVVYGAPGEPLEMHFAVLGAHLTAPSVAWNLIGQSLILRAAIPKDGTDEYGFRVGRERVRILAMSAEMADRTWFVTDGGKKLIVCGPEYVGEVTFSGDRAQIERPSAGASPLLPCVVYSENESQILEAAPISQTPPVPILGAWSASSGDSEARRDYDTSMWKASDAPLPMGADGDNTAYAWYRVNVVAPRAGTFGLNFSDAGDWLAVFVNGAYAGRSGVQPRTWSPVARALSVNLNAGENSVAILAAHSGRMKLYAYIGPLDMIDRKGVSGPVTLSNAPGVYLPIAHWRWKADDRGEPSAGELAASSLNTGGSDWQDAGIGQDVFHNRVGSAWFRADLGSIPGPHRSLHFASVDDNAVVYLNGKKLFAHQGWGDSFDVSLDDAWQENGPNALAVLVGNIAGPGGIFGPVTLTSIPAPLGKPLLGWRMHGGLRVPADAAASWKPVPATAGSGAPVYYRAQFALSALSPTGHQPVLRVSPVGLSRGSVWLNGHNLGRYPERSPVNGLYLPPCWLRSGQNTIIVFDEEGQSPAQVKIVEETGASRDALLLTPRQRATQP